VKYKSGLIRSLFKNAWSISTERDALSCKKSGEKHRINYFDIRGIRIETGLIADTVTVKTSGQTLRLTGLSTKIAESLRGDIETRVKDAVINHVLSREGALPEVESEVQKILDSNQYISQFDVRKWVSQIPDVGQDLAHPYFDPAPLSKRVRDRLEVLLEIREPDSQTLKKANEEFIQKEIERYADLFQQLEKFPLSEEQMRAAIINEDRNLLIAAAGSGKSSTIVAKAIYLVTAGLAKADEILILAFNKDAQVEVEKRLLDLLDVVPNYRDPPKVKTFHSFGSEILAHVEGS
jgi:DNA helicase-4